mgnify:CR=1 FL=1
MISKQYIDAAVSIREEFLQTSKELTEYEKELGDISNLIQKNIDSLSSIKTDLNPTQSPQEIQDRIMKEMDLIEKQGEKYTKLIKPLSDKIEELQKREMSLYNNIRDKYPNLTDEQIVNELRNWIKK